MAHTVQKISTLKAIHLIWWLTIGIQTPFYAQRDAPDVRATVTDCTVDIVTTLTFSLAPRTEPSVGLFYRLDGTDLAGRPIGSYFWKEEIAHSSSGTSKTLTLPQGRYDLVCYQARKGGPLRTAHTPPILVSATCPGVTAMPSVLDVSDVDTIPPDTLRLTASWNVCTDDRFFDASETHKTKTEYATVNTPGEGWLFVTLSAWIPTGQKDVKVLFDNTVLEFVGTVEMNTYGAYLPPMTYATGISYNASASQVEIYDLKGGGNKEAHVHLIFRKKPEGHLASEEKVVFTARILPDDQLASVSMDVLGTPHDPNSMVPYPEHLCSCQKNETLTYRVNFQNKGRADAHNVVVTLMGLDHLDPTSVQIIENGPRGAVTFSRDVPVSYDFGRRTFTITGVFLPGLLSGVAEEDTKDHFMFRINKTDCMPAGTQLQPKASIVFVNVFDYGPIETEPAITEIVDDLPGQMSCNQSSNPECPGCEKKEKECWLKRLIRKLCKKK